VGNCRPSKPIPYFPKKKDVFSIKFINFYETFWNLAGFKAKSKTPESVYADLDKMTKLELFSSMFYPLTVIIVNYLNDNYGGVLTDLMQLSQETVQAYLIMEIKGTEMTFVSKALGSATYAFEPKGDTNNAFTSSIGLTTGSVSRR
jgi:hypothetical protein